MPVGNIPPVPAPATNTCPNVGTLALPPPPPPLMFPLLIINLRSNQYVISFLNSVSFPANTYAVDKGIYGSNPGGLSGSFPAIAESEFVYSESGAT